MDVDRRGRDELVEIALPHRRRVLLRLLERVGDEHIALAAGPLRRELPGRAVDVRDREVARQIVPQGAALAFVERALVELERRADVDLRGRLGRRVLGHLGGRVDKLGIGLVGGRGALVGASEADEGEKADPGAHPRKLRRPGATCRAFRPHVESSRLGAADDSRSSTDERWSHGRGRGPPLHPVRYLMTIGALVVTAAPYQPRPSIVSGTLVALAVFRSIRHMAPSFTNPNSSPPQ